MQHNSVTAAAIRWARGRSSGRASCASFNAARARQHHAAARSAAGGQAQSGIWPHDRITGKDSTTGHWELAGVVLDKPFPTYPNGFPREIIQAFEREIGGPVLGNVPASGTQIIERFGEEHLRTGSPIVYTSVDSVFQVAAHVDVIPEEELYAMCRTARELLHGEQGRSCDRTTVRRSQRGVSADIGSARFQP